jgi:tetratricopeptide (TPR) repeat protein
VLQRLAPAAAVALMLIAAPAWAAVADPAQAAFDQAIDKTKSAMMVDPQMALGLSSKALALARAAPGDPALRVAVAQWLQGEALIRVGRPKDALPVIEQALGAASALQPNGKLQGDLIVAHAGAVSMLGQTETALSDYQRAFEIYRSAGERRGQAVALQDIGSIYQDAGDYQRVLQYYAQSAET